MSENSHYARRGWPGLWQADGGSTPGPADVVIAMMQAMCDAADHDANQIAIMLLRLLLTYARQCVQWLHQTGVETMKKPMIITRWERMREPDGFCATHFGSLQITTKEPRKGEGWEKCVVQVYPGPVEYISREAW